jgi:hypothetical protein
VTDVRSTASGPAVEPPPFKWEALYASSQKFARACVENHNLQDSALFFLHAGASVELAIKAALCRVFVEGGTRFKDRSLLRLMGYRPVVLGKGAQ